ncbi:hypothetical protein OH708_24085 [Pseudomonas capsici]|uniref:hypothetical protein n=1 Tax=Pseudomonas capsici TaxID=2810614 RepID=UPI0021F1BC43|nr:hypothetical protein [Pseudomonas capsici]MCV4287857.1 hypothetical protein [Pseudomonas capsici]MCV4291000.1 hypothetical protein [Pseudomonas capsici]
MTFGARVWNENSSLVMDTTTFTYQIMGQWLLDFSAATPTNLVNYTLSIPGFDPAKCSLVLLPTRSQDIPTSEGEGNMKCYPFVRTAANQVEVLSRNPSASSATLPSRAIVRAMAIRYA